jgi:hypothetical protein
MGSSSASFKDVLAQNLGIRPTQNAAPPVVQQTPSQGPQQSPIRGALQALMNQMMGIRSNTPRSRPAPQASSPRDALIQTLMGGGYGR